MQIITRARFGLAALALTLFALPAAAQGHDHTAGPSAVGAPASAAADSSAATAQQAFALMKSLAGVWHGAVVEPTGKMNVQMQVAFRVTSRGNALVHEMTAIDTVDNPVKQDHPVTMMYIDAGKLFLTHYCDAGNRPRMTARVSADGRQIDFDFLDLTGPTTYGHMQHARFTIVDATHHLEDWTYAAASGQTVTGHFDLHRVSDVAVVTAK